MGQYKPTVTINRPNFLARKVDRLPGVSADALIARANSMVGEEAAGFVDWVESDLETLRMFARKLGHYYEGRKPALLDNLFQIFVAPMFLTAELLIMAGFRKNLHTRVEAYICETYPDYALS